VAPLARKKPVASRAVMRGGKASAASARVPVKSAVRPVAAPVTHVSTKTSHHGTVKFSKKDMEGFRKELIILYEDLTGQIGKMRKSALTRDDEVNLEEDGSDAFDRLFTLERAGTEQETINQVVNALRAIRDGAYGLCDACGCLIEKARLQALPFVKKCVACQSEVERHRAHGNTVSRRMIP